MVDYYTSVQITLHEGIKLQMVKMVMVAPSIHAYLIKPRGIRDRFKILRF